MTRDAAPLVRYRTFASDDGEFYVTFADDALRTTGWTAIAATALDRAAVRDRGLAPELVERIRAAIAGHDVAFTDIDVPPAPPFFLACRRACQRIRAGMTRSYGELASMAGSPAAARAAGQAMRRNPTPIVVPCHRIVGGPTAAAGDHARTAPRVLGGFAGQTDPGCVETLLKARLLHREARGVDRTRSRSAVGTPMRADSAVTFRPRLAR
ncbi:MAG: methylated-DNA--[protein]-cysteine S-methyltransferase [Phycisphaerae bacterium]|nr:methylated-DNA--[protein]-cysteine S-methyltransferase [Phycisphaerae bacterium]